MTTDASDGLPLNNFFSLSLFALVQAPSMFNPTSRKTF